jgi:ornithine cyclodeaminase/alanine dehydrogenase-like protein (mu-crystallin family)
MSAAPSVLLLSRSVIARLATTRDYLDAMQRAFAGLAEQRYRLPEVQHLPAHGGAFHVKSAARLDPPSYAVVKINGNFPGNAAAHGLPTIQGMIALLDADRGCVLAILDSIEITARRTAAATALSARHLARAGSRTLGIVGCGLQARYHIEALRDVARLETVAFCDSREDAAIAFEGWVRSQGVAARRAADARSAARDADIVVTVTTSARPVLALDDVAEGAFVAGVGADNPTKHELAPDLMAASRVVVDSLAQTASGGDLHHAIRAGAMTVDGVHAELAEVVSGRKPGRSREDERCVFDSTGLAVQDHAAVAMVFERARSMRDVTSIRLDDAPGVP